MRNIFGRPERKKPSLGQPPAHLFVEGTTHVKTAGKLRRLKDAVERNKQHVQVILQDYLDVFVESLEDFRIVNPGEPGTHIDDKVVESVTAFLPYRDDFIEFVGIYADYLDSDQSFDRLHGFLEQILPYGSRPASINSWSESWFDNYRFLLYELYLYLVTIIIKKRKYSLAARIIESEFHVQKGIGYAEYYRSGNTGFNDFAESLERSRNSRLRINVTSVMAKMVLDRATHPKYRASDIRQTDVLLFIRPYFPERGGASDWYPRTLNFAPSEPLELLSRATSRKGFEPVAILLRVKTIRDLALAINTAYKNPSFQQTTQGEYMFRVNWQRLLNVEEIFRIAQTQSP